MDDPQTPPTPDLLSSDPGSPDPASPGLVSPGTILPAGEGGPARRRTPVWVLAVAAAAVAALVAGVTYGVAALSGGGRQAADALPAGAAVFVSVDLDPPAGQKVDALRFLRTFPSLRDRVPGDGDLRKTVFDAVAGPAGWGRVDFGRDVAPWLGQRVGAAAYPTKNKAASQPDVVVALQVTDEAAARTGLDTLIAATHGRKPGYVLADGYALLAPTQAAAARAASAAADAPLSGDAQVSADLADLGDAVATFWTDGARAAKIMPADPAGTTTFGLLGGMSSATTTGRAAFVLHFAGPNVLELAGRSVGGDLGPSTSSTVTDLGALPASTVAALGVAGGKDVATPLWRRLTKGSGPADDLAKQAHDQLGLDLPADLGTLLGSQLVLALDGAGLGSGTPAVGARVTTADPAGADALVGRLVGNLPLPGELRPVHHQTDTGYVVATSAAQAARLSTSAGQRLADSADFNQALPDLSTARFALWVDVDAAVKAASTGGGDFSVSPALAPVRGLGVTSSTSTDGDTASFRLRLVVR
jgi:hypothetical protein